MYSKETSNNNSNNHFTLGPTRSHPVRCHQRSGLPPPSWGEFIIQRVSSSPHSQLSRPMRSGHHTFVERRRRRILTSFGRMQWTLMTTEIDTSEPTWDAVGWDGLGWGGMRWEIRNVPRAGAPKELLQRSSGATSECGRDS